MVFSIDTGATKSIISERVYKSIPSANRPKLSKTTWLTDASGQPLSQLGIAEFTITLDGVRFKADIIVANIEDDGLFGHDFLSLGDAHLLYDECALMFMGVHIPCINVHSTPRIGRITAADHLEVPAYNAGDFVWVQIEASKLGIPPKLHVLYRGPCILTQKYNDLDFKVQLSKFGLQQVLHHNKLKPYEGDNVPKWAQKVKVALVTQDQR